MSEIPEMPNMPSAPISAPNVPDLLSGTANPPTPGSPDSPAAYPDYDLPGNDLDPRTPTSLESRRLPLFVKAYGVLCLLYGIASTPLLAEFFGFGIYSALTDPIHQLVGTDPTIVITTSIIGTVLAAAGSVGLIVFGWSLIKNRRRNAAIWSYGLIAITVGQIVIAIMLRGAGTYLIRPGLQLLILIALSATIDPSLRQERDLQRRLEALQDRAAAEEGMLGRDISGEGYIKLNFFNLFWVFMVCCVLGLVLEIAWHMIVVDPGVYQDRAGVLFGPFSPIYGIGAVLMTVALNRFYRAQPIVVFLVSALIGGGFEVLVSWFMQISFGATAWDYSHIRLFGTLPDPVAVLCGGRTCTPFACMWGILGVMWIKLLLPRLLKLINRIPWKWRYSLTAVCAALMIVNGTMTLQALDCWFGRVSGLTSHTPIEEFYAAHFDNVWMAHRFQSMTINPRTSGRMGSAGSGTKA